MKTIYLTADKLTPHERGLLSAFRSLERMRFYRCAEHGLFFVKRGEENLESGLCWHCKAHADEIIFSEKKF